jgi:uridine kinase
LKPYIVGICGASASGKTWLIHELKKILGENFVTVLSQDHYYLPIQNQVKDMNGEVNFDLPSAIDINNMATDLEKLRHGKKITITEYHFNHPESKPQQIEISPAPIILTEGIFIFHEQQIASLLDYKIYIEADESLQLKRRLQRDFSERAIPEKIIHYQWKNHVLPAFEAFILPYRNLADTIIVNNGNIEKNINTLAEHFKNMVNG